jgi:hypothetical protein
MPKMKRLTILSTIPPSGTWFLRYAISFPPPVGRDGPIEDRLADEVVGGPLFWARGIDSDLVECPGCLQSRGFHSEDINAVATGVEASPP